MKKVFIFMLMVIAVVGLIGCAANSEESTETVDSEVIEEMANPIVVFETSMGSFEVELFKDKMPITAGNFEKLVSEGFYDGTRFHRVIADFMIQGGDPQSKDESLRSRWGTGGPGYAIEDEHVAGEGLSNTRGTLSMANSGPNSGGSQFFINVVDNTYLDWNKAPAQSKHPVFGKVVSGMDVVDNIVNTPVNGRDQPVEDVVLTKVSIKE